MPKGDGNDNAVLRRFVTAVHSVAPEAVGTPVFMIEAATTVVKAFLQAGILSLLLIALILFVALRRWIDVALTLVPLLVAIVITLEICVLVGLRLNFANIIALPLLLGVGVAFKIYYIIAWRSGETNFLQSSLTRAILFSACTTAIAFGSLCFSHHPGTSSMGKLMALSLLTTLAAAVIFQPALMATQRSGVSAKCETAAKKQQSSRRSAVNLTLIGLTRRARGHAPGLMPFASCQTSHRRQEQSRCVALDHGASGRPRGYRRYS